MFTSRLGNPRHGSRVHAPSEVFPVVTVTLLFVTELQFVTEAITTGLRAATVKPKLNIQVHEPTLSTVTQNSHCLFHT